MIDMNSHPLVHVAENKYNRLLTVLSLLLVSLALPERDNLPKAIGFILCLVAMRIIVRQIKPNCPLIRVYSLLIISSITLIALQVSGLLSLESSHSAQIVGKVSLIIILSIPVWLIQQEIFIARSVTADTLKGGIAAYLLIGLLWAMFYDVLYSFNHSAFASISPAQNQMDLLHFSFTTLTTLGYGDIQPITALARIMADFEGVMGVMYPSILIARLVSLYETRSQEGS
jgi:hypothetical protein